MLVFACAGGSNVGQISNAAAVDLENRGLGRLYCLAGVAAHIEGMVKTAKSVPVTVAIDGCGSACARKSLEHAGIEPTRQVVVTDLGIKKGHVYEWSPEDLARVVDAAGGPRAETSPCCADASAASCCATDPARGDGA